MRYVHTNIVARDWQKLAEFYVQVFGCTPKPPKREQSGNWLEKGTGVKRAALEGMHLLLPGYGENGPTLELYQYKETLVPSESMPNTRGIGHLAFEVDNVEKTLAQALASGASKIGEISHTHVQGVGDITFIYIRDPEGNIIELQSWR